MCKYCRETFTGEANEDLVFRNIKMNGVDVLGFHTFIEYSKETETVYIKSYLDEAVYGQCIAGKNVKINYCPVCGRKLRKGL